MRAPSAVVSANQFRAMSLAHPVFFLQARGSAGTCFQSVRIPPCSCTRTKASFSLPPPCVHWLSPNFPELLFFSLLQLPGQHRSSRSSGSYLVFNPIDFPPLPVSFRAGVPQGFLQQIIIGEVHFRKAGQAQRPVPPEIHDQKARNGFADQFPDKISAWLGPRLQDVFSGLFRVLLQLDGQGERS